MKKDINGQKNYLKRGYFGDVNFYSEGKDRNGVSIKEFYALLILEKEGSDFGLCLEYQSQYRKTFVEYGVRYSGDGDYLDSSLEDQMNCEKLRKLFEDLKKSAGEGFLSKSECSKEQPGKSFYFSVVKYGLESIMTSDNCYERMKSVLILVEEMFNDALRITW